MVEIRKFALFCISCMLVLQCLSLSSNARAYCARVHAHVQASLFQRPLDTHKNNGTTTHVCMARRLKNDIKIWECLPCHKTLCDGLISTELVFSNLPESSSQDKHTRHAPLWLCFLSYDLLWSCVTCTMKSRAQDARSASTSPVLCFISSHWYYSQHKPLNRCLASALNALARHLFSGLSMFVKFKIYF